MQRVLVLAAAIVAIGSRHADACGVYPVGEMFRDLKLDFNGTHAPVSTPLVIPSAGATTEGWSYGVSVGWAWGEHQTGGLFPGSDVKRVLLHVRRPFAGEPAADATAARMVTTEPAGAATSRTHLALTYGWFDNALVDAGFDVGVAGSSASQLGPTAQLTLGLGGVDLRLSGGMEFGDTTRATGAAELVVDVMALAHRI